MALWKKLICILDVLMMSKLSASFLSELFPNNFFGNVYSLIFPSLNCLWGSFVYHILINVMNLIYNNIDRLTALKTIISSVTDHKSFIFTQKFFLLGYSGSVRSGQGYIRGGHCASFTVPFGSYPRFELRTKGQMQTADQTAPGVKKREVNSREREERIEVTSLDLSSHSWACYTRANSE